jgi:hypothetical protein
MHRSRQQVYSITSSAQCAMSGGGTVRPITLAVLRLRISSTLVDLLDRQFGWLVALENTSGVDARQTARIRNTAAVANQAAGRHEPREFDSPSITQQAHTGVCP